MRGRGRCRCGEGPSREGVCLCPPPPMAGFPGFLKLPPPPVVLGSERVLGREVLGSPRRWLSVGSSVPTRLYLVS